MYSCATTYTTKGRINNALMKFLNCTFLGFKLTMAKQVGHHSTKKLLSSRTRDSPFQPFVLTQKLPLYLRKKSHQSLIHAERKEIGQSRIRNPYYFWIISKQKVILAQKGEFRGAGLYWVTSTFLSCIVQELNFHKIFPS